MDRFPHTDTITIGAQTLSAAEVIDRLGPYLSEARRAKIDAVLADRTYSVAPVLEGLYDRGNVSAVLRSAEALGYQSVHVVESIEPFKKANRVTQGAEKWLDISVWETTEACLADVRARGYRVLAAHVEDAEPVDAFEFVEPAAIFFGNEHNGLSETLLDEADARLRIPTMGFTQSFNISVAAALTLYHVRKSRERAIGQHGDLTEAQQTRLRAGYYLRSVKFAEHLLGDPARAPEATP